MIGQWGRPVDGQQRVRRHRRVGGDPLHAADRRPRDHLRPHAATEELIAERIASPNEAHTLLAQPWIVMTDIALEPDAGWVTASTSNRGRTRPSRPAPRACLCSMSWSRCTTSRPRSPIRCTGCTATCGRASRSRRASPSPTTPASTTRPRIAAELAAELPDVRVVRLEQKGRGRALHAVWSTSDAPVLAYMDVDLSTDLAALAPLVAPLISGHSDLAIGTRLGRGARVVRGPKREIISRCYNLILKSTLAARFSDAQCGFKAIRADVAAAPAAAGRRHRLVLRHRAAGARRAQRACASTRCRWTGSTTPTAASTSSPPRPPTSRASPGWCAASPTARSR